MQQAQTNADPAVAQLRNDAAYVQRTVAALPEGEARQALLDKSAELRGEAEAAAAAASLQPTEVRAGKQQRRRNLRSPDDRVVKALLARSKGDSATLRQRRVQQQQVALEDRCDELPKLAKRGKQVKKVSLQRDSRGAIGRGGWRADAPKNRLAAHLTCTADARRHRAWQHRRHPAPQRRLAQPHAQEAEAAVSGCSGGGWQRRAGAAVGAMALLGQCRWTRCFACN